MRPHFRLWVNGGNTHLVDAQHLTDLQKLVGDLGAVAYPLFLRLGGSSKASMQPVTARAVLAEVEHALRRLEEVSVPGILFLDARGAELGAMYGPAPAREIMQGKQVSVAVVPEGIRLTVPQFPPPVGFRSRPGLPSGHYECYFERITCSDSEWCGVRTAAMGGSGAAVPLPPLTVPPATRWDIARVSGKPAVAALAFAETPVASVYRDAIHALVTACNDSIRLRAPLQMRSE